MTIPEMHVWFRQYAQQMGMQNVRAILPEQIDLVINTSIIDIVNQLIRENLGVVNDRIVTDNSKIGQINALKTLYTVETVDVNGYKSNTKRVQIPIPRRTGDCIVIFSSANIVADATTGWKTDGVSGADDVDDIETAVKDFLDGLDSVISYNVDASSIVAPTISSYGSVSVDITYNAPFNIYSATYTEVPVGQGEPNLVVVTSPVNIVTSDKFDFTEDGIVSGMISATSMIDKPMFIVDFAVNYKKASRGMKINNVSNIVYATGEDAFTTAYFPVRWIDNSYLADTLNDFVLKPRLRTPVVVVYNDNYDFYFGKFVKTSNNEYTLDNSLCPYKFRVSYIAKPVEVKYGEDYGVPNVDCNLPESLHVDILKHAVDLYRTAITGGLYASQQQAQAQQQEYARNNDRPANENYQN